jgi:biopolymer transport protein ExbD
MTRAVHVELPETDATTAVEQGDHVQVSMDAAGRPFIDNRPVTLEELEAELRSLHAANANLTVQVHGDTQTPYGRIALMMALLQRVGITKIDLVTIPLP